MTQSQQDLLDDERIKALAEIARINAAARRDFDKYRGAFGPSVKESEFPRFRLGFMHGWQRALDQQVKNDSEI